MGYGGRVKLSGAELKVGKISSPNEAASIAENEYVSNEALLACDDWLTIRNYLFGIA